jgi:hypothetical protein
MFGGVEKDYAEHEEQAEDVGREARFFVDEQADADHQQDGARYIGKNLFAVGPGWDWRHAALPAAAGEIFNGENEQGKGEEEAAELG